MSRNAPAPIGPPRWLVRLANWPTTSPEANGVVFGLLTTLLVLAVVAAIVWL